MKRLIFILFIVGCVSLSFGQKQIILYEYWFDSNYDAKSFVETNSVQELNLNTSINTGILSVGLHTFHIRFKDNTNQWSSTTNQFFLKLSTQENQSVTRKINTIEYWFDNEFSSKNTQTCSEQDSLVLVSAIKTDALTIGLHTFHIRFKDNTNQWSSTTNQFFLKLSTQENQSVDRKINAIEYWFDNDFISKNTQTCSEQDSLVLVSAIKTDALPIGLHTFHIRFKDNTGEWSSTTNQFFIKLSPLENQSVARKINTIEYWFDNDFNSRNTQACSEQDSLVLVSAIKTDVLTIGLHTFHIRFKDNTGQWSSTTNQFFIKLSTLENQPVARKITAIEYWFDNDFISKNTQTCSEQDSLVLVSAIKTDALPIGLHTFHIRFKDNTGEWSSPVNQFFIKPDKWLSVNINNNITDYRYWIEGEDSIFTKQVSPAVNPLILFSDLDSHAFELDTGSYTIHFQFRDSLGLWSSPTGGAFKQTIDCGPPRFYYAAPAPDYSYVDITMSEKVYTSKNAEGVITVDDLQLLFRPNAGTLTNIAITGISNTLNQPLVGGETTIRVKIALTGTPSGVETFEIKPRDGNSVFDGVGNAMKVTETTDFILFNQNLLPFNKWTAITIPVNTQQIYRVYVPERTLNLFFLVRKSTKIGHHGTWTGIIKVFRQGVLIAERSGMEDFDVHFKNAKGGLYHFEIWSNDNAEAEIKVCDNLDKLNFGEWHKGLVLKGWGHDWTQVDVPPNTEALFFETQGFGVYSNMRVYRETLGSTDEHWYFDKYQQGYHLTGKILKPKAGRYLFKYEDSDNVVGGTSQERDYLLNVDIKSIKPLVVDQKPVITGLSTHEVGQGPVTLEVYGQNLDSNLVIYYFSGTDTVFSSVDKRFDNKFYSQFDFSFATKGNGIIEIINPSTNEREFSTSLKITNAIEELKTEIIGRSLIRVGRTNIYDIVLTNVGNVDLTLIYFSVELYDGFNSQFLVPLNLKSGTLYPYGPFQFPLGGPQSKYQIPVNLPSEKCVQIKVNPVIQKPLPPCDEKLCPWVNNKIIETNDILKKKKEDLDEAKRKLSNIDYICRTYNLSPDECLNQKNNFIRQINNLIDDIARLKENLKKFESWYQKCCTQTKSDNFESDNSILNPFPTSSFDFCSASSSTPEDKYGTAGFGANGQIAKNQDITYKIDFWNHEKATAPAQQVFIKDTLDVDLNDTTLAFTQFGFLRWKVPLNAGTYFNVNVDMRPEMNLIVNAVGKYNYKSRELSCTFTSLDPITMQLTDEPLLGFLPPIDSTGYQIGWVEYKIEPNKNLPDGAKITNRAWVNFDGVGPTNPAPKEAPWSNTIDDIAPLSNVLVLPAQSFSDSLLVKWTGTDAGSGIKNYTVYVAEGAGDFNIWLENYSDTSAYFIGENNKTYRFYCIAKDQVNNTEPAKNSYEAQVTFLFSKKSQTINLTNGWNIFSGNVIPENRNMEVLFQSLKNDSSLVKVQDETGNSLEDLGGVFGGWSNNIGNLKMGKGYKVKVKQNCQLNLSGTPAIFPIKIPLKAGWNIIGYPRITEADALLVLQQLKDRGTLIKVQDETGNSLEDWGTFGDWTNNIGNLIPGEGYKIKLRTNDTLTIYESYAKSGAESLKETTSTSHFLPAFEGNGVDHMNINLVGLSVNNFQSGDELAVFDRGICVGAIKLQPYHLEKQTVSIPSSATDSIDQPGFTENNTFTLKLWKSETGKKYIILPDIVNGTSTFTKHETTVASLEKFAITGMEGISGSALPEIKVYPNPFSDEITVEINLAADAQVQVEVLNQSGQRVKMIATKQLLPGSLHKLTWDGRNAGNQIVSPGIYYLKVNIDGTYIHRKIVYSK